MPNNRCKQEIGDSRAFSESESSDTKKKKIPWFSPRSNREVLGSCLGYPIPIGKICALSFCIHQSVCRFKTPCKTHFIEILIIFQPFRCMDESIIFSLFYRKGIIIRIVDLPIDDHQLLIHFPWNPYFVDHICRMRVIPYADTYRLSTELHKWLENIGL